MTFVRLSCSPPEDTGDVHPVSSGFIEDCPLFRSDPFSASAPALIEGIVLGEERP
jgi:hypothetical protein